MKVKKEDVRAMVYGLAAGDALGVPVEFKSREELAQKPVIDMRGHGTYGMPMGTWSDDTSMTLCLMESIARQGQIDFFDIMNNFDRWAEGGEFTATGETFDMGACCASAILRYMEEGADPLSCGNSGEKDNGNGSLMRISPLAVWLARHPEASMGECLELVHNVSSLTHAHPRSKLACGLYVLIILYLLQGRELKDAIRTGLSHGMEYYIGQPEYKNDLAMFRRLAAGNFASLPEKAIKSSGYVVDSLEAAIWCLLNTSSYKECMLKAVNLGSDTDTVAAIAGAVAGLAYGFEAIPNRWSKSLKNRELLDEICEGFCTALGIEN